MKKPEPQIGLVIRYDYLWDDEARSGREEGAKDRPCAVVIADNGKGQTLVCAITHSPPRDKTAAIEIPAAVSRHLGLDENRSWIVVGEVNRLRWDDPGIQPVAPGRRWEYGYLPPGLAKAALDRVDAHFRARTLAQVDREKIEKQRERRERDDRER